MTDLPDLIQKIEVEESRFRSSVSESTIQKIGSSINFILDHFSIFPGMIFDFAGLESAVPSAFLVCDGRNVSRTTYANLFAAIGTQWGIGDGSTSFNVPDLRGTFTRMVDTTTLGTKGYDTDASSRTPIGTGLAAQVGSFQADQFASHRHGVPAQSGQSGTRATFPANFTPDFNYDNLTDDRGGSETRPKNMYVIKMIKW